MAQRLKKRHGSDAQQSFRSARAAIARAAKLSSPNGAEPIGWFVARTDGVGLPRERSIRPCWRGVSTGPCSVSMDAVRLLFKAGYGANGVSYRVVPAP